MSAECQSKKESKLEPLFYFSASRKVLGIKRLHRTQLVWEQQRGDNSKSREKAYHIDQGRQEYKQGG